MVYAIVGIIFGCVWGVVCNNIISSKGYSDNWFWWGFFFGIIAVIVALSKPACISTGSSGLAYPGLNTGNVVDERHERNTLSAGGWKCAYCGKVNAKYVGTCGCGKTKAESENKPLHDMEVINAYNQQKLLENKNTETNKEISNIEVLKQYKELLDMGAITQEEYDKKKSELL